MINLTPHTIRIVRPDGSLIWEIPPSGTIARVAMVAVSLRPIYSPDNQEIPLCRQEPGPVTGLPEWTPTEQYIVSAMVRTASPDRRDLFSPGELVRDAAGQPIGCLGLVSN